MRSNASAKVSYSIKRIYEKPVDSGETVGGAWPKR